LKKMQVPWGKGKYSMKTLTDQWLWHETVVTGVWLQPCVDVCHKSICSEFWFSAALTQAGRGWCLLTSVASVIPWQLHSLSPSAKPNVAASSHTKRTGCFSLLPFFIWMSLRGSAAVWQTVPHTMKCMWWDYILRESICTWDHRK